MTSTAPQICSISHNDGLITLKADPSIAKNLSYILSALLELSHELRAKTEHERANQAAKDPRDIARRAFNFDFESLWVFTEYQKHLDNGCNGDKKAAIQLLKKEWEMGYGETKILIIRGRKIVKEIANTRRPKS